MLDRKDPVLRRIRAGPVRNATELIETVEGWGGANGWCGSVRDSESVWGGRDDGWKCRDFMRH